MKKPRTPPPCRFHLGKKFNELLDAQPQPTHKGEYLHWDEVRYRTPPDGLAREEWWAAFKLQRSFMSKPLPCLDVRNLPFVYCTPSPLLQKLHELDRQAAGQISAAGDGVTEDLRDRYIIRSLREEAISSSLLEGAATTRQEAKTMLREGHKPRGHGEKMVLNNYLAMRRIMELRGKPLTLDLVFELHKTIVNDTLKNPDAAGRFRRSDEKIEVVDDTTNEVLHTPPPADELHGRIARMIAFANGQIEQDEFIHPVVRAMTLHFWLAHDHPFVDGNGRCARALFYWAMFSAGYWLFEFVSISEIIYRAPLQYERAFLYTESDENDLTYFLMHQINVAQKAIDRLHEHLDMQAAEMQKVERLARNSGTFNRRQLDLLSHALRNPDARYTTESHGSSQGIARPTARLDLLNLTERGFLDKRQSGKTLYFLPAENLRRKLAGKKPN